MEKIYDIAVIGGGPGGIYASFLAEVKGLTSVLIEASDYLGGQPLTLYSQKAIYDYPCQYGAKGHELIGSLVGQLKEHSKTKIYLKTKLIKFEKKDNQFFIDLSNGEKIISKKIIIAIGGGLLEPIRLDVHGASTCSEIEYTVSEFSKYTNKKILILGGGDSAVDWANELGKRNICESVSIIHRRDVFRANGENVNNLENNKVKIILDTTPTKINENFLEISNNKTQEISTIPFDKIIIQYGQKNDQTNNHVFSTIERNEQNRIIVKENQMTNIDGIYAIGNICIYKNKPSSIIASHGEAARAVKDALNTLKIYDKY